MLQDDGSSPGFVSEVVGLFIDDAEKITGLIAGLLSVLSPTPTSLVLLSRSEVLILSACVCAGSSLSWTSIRWTPWCTN
jgi:Flp pilus assembly protein CpaB